jgi:antitoxin component YwqK of YwqJK toxin-antitoxin module
MKNINLYFLPLLTILFSCTQKRVDNKSYIITKDGLGNIQSEINYINDTIVNGTAKYYYKNGKLNDEINYVNGLKNGIHKHYSEDGVLESVINFKNGLQDGYAYWYFKNGKVESKSFWLKGKSFGDAYYYYSSGLLESYRSFDFQEHNRYLIKYDSNGLKIKEEGTVLGQLLLDADFNAVPLNKSVTLRISVATPPNTNTKVLLNEMKRDMLMNAKELIIKNSEAVYNLSFNEKGKYKFVTVGQIKDLKGNVVKQDTIYTDINVTE